jgi:hypothetical protein
MVLHLPPAIPRRPPRPIPQVIDQPKDVPAIRPDQDPPRDPRPAWQEKRQRRKQNGDEAKTGADAFHGRQGWESPVRAGLRAASFSMMQSRAQCESDAHDAISTRLREQPAQSPDASIRHTPMHGVTSAASGVCVDAVIVLKV